MKDTLLEKSNEHFKNIESALAKKKYYLIPAFLLVLIVSIKPILDLFGIKYSLKTGLSLIFGIVFISLVIIAGYFLKSFSISGIYKFYPTRNNLNQDFWQKFFLKRIKHPKNVYILGQSLSRTFSEKGRVEEFIKWCNSGTNFQIIFLSPENTELSQLQNIGKGLKNNTYGFNPNDILRKKIYETYHFIEENFISKIADISKKPQVRFATCDLPFSINAIDEKMLVTFYGTGIEADEQPTVQIRGEKSDSYQCFLKEFNSIWSNYSKVYPEIDSIVKSYKNDWNTYINLKKYELHLPSPKQAIIFPTYQCKEQCQYCMFKSTRTNGNILDMDLHVFEKILNELKINGIKKIEIAGGGEPFEHSKFNEIFSCLEKFRKENPDISLGILTNGLHLDDFPAEKLFEVFNDYIRISRYERILNDQNLDSNSIWMNNAKRLLEFKINDNTVKSTLGIKYLLTQENKLNFIKLIEADFSNKIFQNFDHIRFKSDRRINNDEITKIEQEVYYTLKKCQIANFEKKVSLSLTNFIYPNNFKCWISPIHIVFSPEGNLYLCCNYVQDRPSKSIGNINKGSFKDIWNNEKHVRLRKNLEKNNCNRSDYTNCRFAEIQNVFEQIASTIGELN